MHSTVGLLDGTQEARPVARILETEALRRDDRVGEEERLPAIGDAKDNLRAVAIRIGEQPRDELSTLRADAAAAGLQLAVQVMLSFQSS